MSKVFLRVNNYLKYAFVFASFLLIVLGILKYLNFYSNNNKSSYDNIESNIAEYLQPKLQEIEKVSAIFERSYLKDFEYVINYDFLTDNKEILIEGIDNKGELIFWQNINESNIREILLKHKGGNNFITVQNSVYYFVLKNYFIKNNKYVFAYYIKIDFLNSDGTAHNLSFYLSNKLNKIVKVSFSNTILSEKLFYNNQISVKIDNIKINDYQDISPYSINNLFNTGLFLYSILIYLIIVNIIQHTKNKITNFFGLVLFTIFYRYLIFVFDLANIYPFKPFSNPANYSSNIAYGILKSPIDLTISLLFFAFIVYYLLIKYSELNFKNVYVKIFSVSISTFFTAYISYLFIRVLKSFFYDGNIKYFKLSEFYYDFVTYLMLFNALIIGILYIYLTLFFINFVYKNLGGFKRSTKIFFLIIILLIIFILTFNLTGTKYLYGNILLSVYFTLIIYLLINREESLISKKTLIFCLLAGSLITNFVMGIIYTETEKDKLKLASFELTRIDENIINFFIRESLINAGREFSDLDNNVIKDFKYESYKIWNKSKIKSENLITEYYFLDSNKNYLGGVNFSFPYEYSKNWHNEEVNDIKMVEDTVKEGIIISGLIPLKKGKIYFGVSVYYNKYGYNYADVPSILRRHSDNKIYFDDYRIFWVKNYEITFKKADIDINKDVIKDLIYSAKKDGFVTKTINSQRFLFYVVSDNDLNRYLIIGYKTRDFSWNIYDFVKIFIVHFIFIVIISLLSSFLQVFTTGLPSFNYQARLLSGILIVTIIPLIILAIYFDDTIKDKLENSIRLNLMNQAKTTANFLEEYGQDSNISFRDLIIKTNNDLNINFTLFSDNEVKYSTYLDYYYLGGLSFYLDYNVYKGFRFNKINEIFVKSNLKNQTVYSYFKKTKIKGEDYILEVNDSVNKFYMVFDTSEINLFLYGIYSFAIIIIVIMSILLTRRISKPILSLTKAAGEVANGNFEIYLSSKDKGEIGDLMQSFNFMVKELKRFKEELSIKEREAAWREMAKQVAHEIKNPLTPMKLSIQLLIQAFNDNSPKFPEIFNKVTVTIANQIETLKRIADEFSVVAKLPSLNIGVYNIVELINDVAKLYSGNDIDIVIESEKDTIWLNLDAEQFKRIIINLIKNSIEANANKINVIILESDKYIKIIIEDNGNGIEEIYKERIFEDKFTTKPEGTGIGLSIVKNILYAFNAQIVLKESYMGKTVFEITFNK
jgi:signal transduction histidine kinase